MPSLMRVHTGCDGFSRKAAQRDPTATGALSLRPGPRRRDNKRLAWLIILMAAVSSLFGEGRAGSPRPSEEITVDITGTPGVVFAADCALRTAEGEVEFGLAGTVPYQKAMHGYGLRCQVGKLSGHGSLAVEVRKGKGIVSRSNASGEGGHIIITVQ